MKVLALLDSRNSNSIQTLTVAQGIAENSADVEINTKQISYNAFVALPNFLRTGRLIGIDWKKSDPINFDLEEPDVIIAAGRRLALLAAYLKKNFWHQVDLIQIMNPNCNFNHFHTIILPNHDRRFWQRKRINILPITGALCKLSNDTLNEEEKRFSEIKKFLHEPYITVLVGGSSKHFNFSNGIARKLAVKLSKLSTNNEASLLVSTSRRTSAKIVKILKDNLSCDNYFFEWKRDIEPRANPYFAFLKLADYFVITGDSISMISEVLATGKPVYLFTNGIKSSKYKRFHRELIKKGLVRKINRKLVKLEPYNYESLNEVDSVITILKSRLGIK